MATESITRGVLLVASEEIGQAATKVLNASGALNAKAVTGPRAALAAVAQLTPHFLVFEAGRVPVPAMQAVKNMAELSASRPVQVLMVCGPLQDSVEQLKETLGIVQVLDSPYESSALLEALKSRIEKMEQAKRDSQERKLKQQQIRERLRTASNKYAAMSAEAAAMHLEQRKREEEQEEQEENQSFEDMVGNEDETPPTEPEADKPPDKPTWDGSG